MFFDGDRDAGFCAGSSVRALSFRTRVYCYNGCALFATISTISGGPEVDLSV